MAKPRPATQRHVCPACGTAGDFRSGEPVVCKVCGTAIASVPAPATAPVRHVAVPPAASMGGPATGLAVASLVCGVLSLVTFWVFPISLLLAVAALGCGIAALAQDGGDSGSQVMAGIGVGLAVLGIVLLWTLWLDYDSSGSSIEFDSGGSGGGGDTSGSGGGGGGGGGSGGNDGGSSGGGTAGGGSGGGGGGVEVGGGGEAAPAPVALLTGTLLLSLAAWRRRR